MLRAQTRRLYLLIGLLAIAVLSYLVVSLDPFQFWHKPQADPIALVSESSPAAETPPEEDSKPPLSARVARRSPFPFDPSSSTPTQKRTTEELEASIKQLGDMNNVKVAHAGIELLDSAGEFAFPVLIAHLNDQTPANTCFGKAVGVPPGVVYPTIGDVCWDTLHWQIMGSYAKAFPEGDLLTPSNIADWFAAHKEMNLWELRIAALQEEIALAEKSDPPNEPYITQFMERLAIVEALAKNAQASAASK